MKLLLATIQTPFIRGGAEYHIGGLRHALVSHGHTVERIALPFRFNPPEQVRQNMEAWANEDLTLLNGHQADRVICLQFPTYYAQHPQKTLWLLHQFRVAYELWDTAFGAHFRDQPGASRLRETIVAEDNKHLAGCSPRFANSRNVAARLQRYNNVSSEPLYHPPFMAEEFYTAHPERFIFLPSRFEEAKRQALLIRAMAYVRSNVVAILCGEGGQEAMLTDLVRQTGTENKVKFVGHVTEAEKIALYAHALAVFFAPFDEDYGYVTLEAMLASKPVITCSDSGGPLEFVIAGETGLVAQPEPEHVAAAIDELAADPARAKKMGAEGRARYRALDISWDNVVARLTAE